MELKSQNNLKEKDKNLSEEIKKKHPDFYYLDKMKDSLKENEKELIKRLF